MSTNLELVKHAEKCLEQGYGYVYGTFGQLLTQKLLDAKQAQYPSRINPYLSYIKSHWMGKHVTDCVGLIKDYLWEGNTYDAGTDVSADGMYSRATEKGTLITILNIPGILVWKKGHIGVYLGDGFVIEANSTKRGVIKTPLTGVGSTRWTNWCKCPYIDYQRVELDISVIFKDLAERKIINSPDYWINSIEGGKPINSNNVKLLVEKLYEFMF